MNLLGVHDLLGCHYKLVHIAIFVLALHQSRAIEAWNEVLALVATLPFLIMYDSLCLVVDVVNGAL